VSIRNPSAQKRLLKVFLPEERKRFVSHLSKPDDAEETEFFEAVRLLSWFCLPFSS
jgi:hypothetical protein